MSKSNQDDRQTAKAEPRSKMVTGIAKIIEQQCTAKQVYDLLKRFKDLNERAKDEIRLSGSKEELIRSVVRCKSLGIIPDREVHELIRESE